MGKPTAFKEIKRQTAERRPVQERVNDFKEIYKEVPEEKLREQASRCMDCGTPFCHSGCPLGNKIPDWNDLVYKNKWQYALERLLETNNFPEFTGRLCPALCEGSCVLGLVDEAVTIRQTELSIIERGFKEGWVKPQPPAVRTGKKVAVVGSGPAGLAAAQQLNRVGHTVTLFERAEKIGGILALGIPDFKIEKWVVERRVKLLEEEGVILKPATNVGVDYPTEKLLKEFDAVCLAGGSTKPRDLVAEGRDVDGVFFAMDYLIQQNKLLAGENIPSECIISAKDKNVVVIGGGDTGADCVGTAHRQGAKEVYQLELMPKPTEGRDVSTPWPLWPMMLRTSSSHEEGATTREWSILTKGFTSKDGKVAKLHGVKIEWVTENGKTSFKEVPGSEFEIETQLVLLAMGFLHPEHEGMLADLGVKLDGRGNIATDDSYMTSVPGVFAAGDMRRGQSLIVWAISEGRKAAQSIDDYLMKN